MNRGIRIAASAMVLLTGLALSKPAVAIGLGEARVDSFLNQPLDVQVRLLEVSQADLDSLSVQIGSASDYERLGLMGDVLGLNVTASIDRSQSPPVLRVRSQRPARDPVVQLLVDARWSSGRILREYTLFLDPPTVTAAPPARTAPEPIESRPPAPARPAAQPAPPQSAADTQTVPAAPVIAASTLNSRDQYSVQPGDTLWSVAQDARPDTQLSMSQTMLAIVDLNPTAFRNGNVHQMLSGAQLALPDREQISTIDRQLAEQTVTQQNRAFNQRVNAPVSVQDEANPVIEELMTEAASVTDEVPSPVAEPETAPAESEAATDSTTTQGEEFRLELVPPAEGDEGLGLSAEEREANRLRQQLAREEEELFTAQLEAEQLQERVAELETMVNDNPSGVGIRDFDLAQLEQTLRAARLAASEQFDPAIRAEVSGQVEEYLQQFAAVPDEPINAQAMDAQPSDEEENASANSEPVVTQIGEPRSGLASWFGNPLLLLVFGIIALLILLLIVWLWLKRVGDSDANDTSGTRALDTRTRPTMQSSQNRVALARQQVQDQPTDLDRHLKLLEVLSSHDEMSEFSSALETMYTQVEHDEQPQWQHALKLAATTVPDHALVLGNMDWDPDPDRADDIRTSDDRPAEPGMVDQPADNIEELHGLLTEAELEETDSASAALDDAKYDDDSDLPVERGMTEIQTVETRDEQLDTPLLHEDDREGDWEPGTEEAAVELDETVESEDFVAERILEDGVDGEVADTTPLAFDWPEASEGDAAAEAPAASEPVETSSDDGSMQDEDDIFSASDDDVDVKLDLARAYLSWNSIDSARTLLEEVVVEGNSQQREQAKKLLDDIE